MLNQVQDWETRVAEGALMVQSCEAVARAVEDVVLAYHRAIDTGRASAGVDLFAEDAVFQAKGMELVGRAAIAGFLAERESQRDRYTVHVLANTTVRRVEQDEIELAAFVLLHVRRSDGRYELDRVLDTMHVLKPGPSGWLIHQRLSHPLHPSEPVDTR